MIWSNKLDFPTWTVAKARLSLFGGGGYDAVGNESSKLAHQQPAPPPRNVFRLLDKLVDPVGLKNFVLVTGITLFVYLVGVLLVQEPATGLVHRVAYRPFIPQAFVLTVVAQTQYGHHSQFVGPVQDLREPVKVGLLDIPACVKGRVVPRLGFGTRKPGP